LQLFAFCCGWITFCWFVHTLLLVGCYLTQFTWLCLWLRSYGLRLRWVGLVVRFTLLDCVTLPLLRLFTFGLLLLVLRCLRYVCLYGLFALCLYVVVDLVALRLRCAWLLVVGCWLVVVHLRCVVDFIPGWLRWLLFWLFGCWLVTTRIVVTCLGCLVGWLIY